MTTTVTSTRFRPAPEWSQVEAGQGTLRLGQVGPSVEQLQTRLNVFLQAQGKTLLKVDGKFGVRTDAALRDFQDSKRIRKDGVFGADSFSKLTGQPAVASVSQADSVAVGPASTKPLSSFNNTRVDTQLPASGEGFSTYKLGSHRWGTARTIESIKRIARNFHAATGKTVRIGDISAKGGAPIPDHKAHRNGKNIDFDMMFTDGRTTAEPNRNSKNATWRSAAYDRNATRKLIQEIRRVRPSAVIFFNDPVLVREGLVRTLANHDNHLHVQGLN